VEAGGFGPASEILALSQPTISDHVRSLERVLGVRLIEGPLAGAMTPIFQTSANRSGEPAPHRFEDVGTGIVAGADLAIDGGELTGAPSTVVDLTQLDSTGTWNVLREGGLERARLEEALA